MRHLGEATCNTIGLLGLAAIAGIAIAAADNFAFGGEISPIAVIALLLLATASLGLGGGRSRWPVILAIWIWLPTAHVVEHVLRLPDTLHPNTYASIAGLAAFSLAVCAVGYTVGLIVRRGASSSY